MKKTLLAGCLMLAGMSLFAQSHHFTPFQKSTQTKQQLLVQSLLDKQTAASGTAQKPTGMKQRVIAQADISAENGVVDTVTFKYSGTRGSNYNHNVVDDFGYRSYFTSDYLTGPYSQSLAKKSTDILADTITSYDGDDPYLILKAFYRTDNMIDSFFEYSLSTSVTTTKNIHQYNSAGRMSQYFAANNYVNPAVFDTSELRKLWYNTAGTQLLKDTVYEPETSGLEPYYTSIYHYNPQNNLDSILEYENGGGSYDLYNVTAISYDANNRVTKVIQAHYNSFNSTIDISTDSMAYIGNSSIFNFYQNVSYYGTDTSVFKVIKHAGANNLPDSAAFYSNEAGTLEMLGTVKYFYNSYNNPDSVIAHDIDGEYLGRYNFYYETYDDGNNVGIKDPKANKNFNVYPNPFDSKINIDWKNATTQAKISFINMMGQTIYTTNKSLSTGNNVIDIPATAGGNYILMIQDEKGNIYNQKLSKK